MYYFHYFDYINQTKIIIIELPTKQTFMALKEKDIILTIIGGGVSIYNTCVTFGGIIVLMFRS